MQEYGEGLTMSSIGQYVQAAHANMKLTSSHPSKQLYAAYAFHVGQRAVAHEQPPCRVPDSHIRPPFPFAAGHPPSGNRTSCGALTHCFDAHSPYRQPGSSVSEHLECDIQYCRSEAPRSDIHVRANGLAFDLVLFTKRAMNSIPLAYLNLK